MGQELVKISGCSRPKNKCSHILKLQYSLIQSQFLVTKYKKRDSLKSNNDHGYEIGSAQDGLKGKVVGPDETRSLLLSIKSA